MARLFNNVGALHPKTSVFDLSHNVKFDGDMGVLYPILVEDCIPGDVWRLSNSIVCRFHQALFAPLLDEVNIYVHYFFVPYRILWDRDKLWQSHPSEQDAPQFPWPGSFEKFISGGRLGDLVLTLPRASYPADFEVPGGIQDFLYGVRTDFSGLPATEQPLAFPSIAYIRTFNEYYRSQDLERPIDALGINYPGDIVDPTHTMQPCMLPNGLCLRSWEKDYFTSALPWPQRGTAPVLPITLAGTLTVDQGDFTGPANSNVAVSAVGGSPPTPNSYVQFSGSQVDQVPVLAGASGIPISMASFLTSHRHEPGDLSVDVSSATATAFNINDLRAAFQLQKWMERNARAGVRFIELLLAHFGTSPRDERLDRPEYIGGTFAPIVFSEVLQTSESDSTPLGHPGGHGISINGSFAAKYHVKEHGVLMAIMSVMPRTSYQQGVDRMWLRNTKEEYYWPEFAHLGEQGILNEEILARSAGDPLNTGISANTAIFGFQGRYDEYRYRKSKIHGNLRSDSPISLDFWHLGRYFDPTSPVSLNSFFLRSAYRNSLRIYPVQDEPGMIFNVGHHISVVRPMPFIGEPGLLDHF